jgi:hypothetical protein
MGHHAVVQVGAHGRSSGSQFRGFPAHSAGVQSALLKVPAWPILCMHTSYYIITLVPGATVYDGAARRQPGATQPNYQPTKLPR